MLLLISKIFTILLLLFALGDQSLEYYNFLRLVVFVISILLAYRSYKIKKENWIWIFSIVAFIFNPIVPIRLSREIWAIIDLFTAIVFFVSIFKIYDKNSKITKKYIANVIKKESSYFIRFIGISLALFFIVLAVYVIGHNYKIFNIKQRIIKEHLLNDYYLMKKYGEEEVKKTIFSSDKFKLIVNLNTLEELFINKNRIDMDILEDFRNKAREINDKTYSDDEISKYLSNKRKALDPKIDKKQDYYENVVNTINNGLILLLFLPYIMFSVIRVIIVIFIEIKRIFV